MNNNSENEIPIDDNEEVPPPPQGPIPLGPRQARHYDPNEEQNNIQNGQQGGKKGGKK